MQANTGFRIGFFKRSKARRAEEAIGQSESRLTVSRLAPADLRPANEALKIAKKLFDARQFSKAVKAAETAESLAIILDERFNRYQDAVKGIRTRIASMRRLGLRTEGLEAALGRAEEQVVAGVWEDGMLVPNYREARAQLERMEREGHHLQKKAERAASEIFRAEVALNALADVAAPDSPLAFAEALGSALERSLQEATEELALGNADGAGEIALDITKTAVRLRDRSLEAMRSLHAMEAQLAVFRGEGILTQALQGQVKMARDALDAGLIEPAAAMASRLQAEVRSLGDLYRKACNALADAEVLYARLAREGFQSYEADAAMRDARRWIREGKYARGIDHVERAMREFACPAVARERQSAVALLDRPGHPPVSKE